MGQIYRKCMTCLRPCPVPTLYFLIIITVLYSASPRLPTACLSFANGHRLFACLPQLVPACLSVFCSWSLLVSMSSAAGHSLPVCLLHVANACLSVFCSWSLLVCLSSTAGHYLSVCLLQLFTVGCLYSASGHYFPFWLLLYMWPLLFCLSLASEVFCSCLSFLCKWSLLVFMSSAFGHSSPVCLLEVATASLSFFCKWSHAYSSVFCN